MKKYYYLNRSKQQCGPVDESELKNYDVTPETLVWAEGMAGWQKAVTVVPGCYLAGAAVPPPPHTRWFGLGNPKLYFWTFFLIVFGMIIGKIVNWYSPVIASFFPMVMSANEILYIFFYLYLVISVFILVKLFIKTRHPSKSDKPSTIIQVFFLSMMIVACVVMCRECIRTERCEKVVFSMFGPECFYEYHSFSYHELGDSEEYIDKWRNPIFTQSDLVFGRGRDKNGDVVYIGCSGCYVNQRDLSGMEKIGLQVYTANFVLQDEYETLGFHTYSQDERKRAISDKLRYEGIVIEDGYFCVEDTYNKKL